MFILVTVLPVDLVTSSVLLTKLTFTTGRRRPYLIASCVISFIGAVVLFAGSMLDVLALVIIA